MPIQTPQWTEFLTCPICCNEFDDSLRRPISLGCGHTMCKACLSTLHKTQCPFDQAAVSIDIDKLPVNTALLQLVGVQDLDEGIPDIECIKENKTMYLNAIRKIKELALYLKFVSASSNGASGSTTASNGANGNTGLTRPMQRKLVNLVNCQLAEEEGRTRVMRAARSLGERTVTELMLLHQNPQQLSANLWAAVRNRGCQFLGPAMQEEALKLILLALEGGEALCRKVLVLFVVQKLESMFPQASKTSIGHVVQLLYRASCFVVTKRDDDSSLMQLKEQFRTYDALRREHDAQIVQIAMEAGLRISPEQWSSVLYGDLEHKSHMQSIIDKLQTPQSFSQSIIELIFALQRSNDPGELIKLRPHFELLSNIDASPEAVAPTWDKLEEAMNAVHAVVSGLVNFARTYGNKMKGSVDPPQPNHNYSKYKTSLCRDQQKPGGCPRGSQCSFAHSEEELEKFGRRRTKTKSNVVARGPSSMSSDLCYSSMESGLDQASSGGATQSQQMNGSARSSPCGELGANSFAPTPHQYRRVNPDPMPRIKQMNIHTTGPQGYSSSSFENQRMSYPSNGERSNGFYYPSNGYPSTGSVPLPSPGIVDKGPPPGLLPSPSSSPLTIQEDSINGSRDSMLNGHADNGMPLRRVRPRQFDPQMPRRTTGYMPSYDSGYGTNQEPYNYSAQGSVHPASFGRYPYHDSMPYGMPNTSCRPDAAAYDYYQYGPGPYSRPELYVDSYPMPNINARILREEMKYVKRSPYIPDEMELQDSPRTSDLGEETTDHLTRDYYLDDWLRDYKPVSQRKDTTLSNASSGVGSASPLSHSPAASQSSSSSLSPRQESPVGWCSGSDGDKILQTYIFDKASTAKSSLSDSIWNGEMRKLWHQPLVDSRSGFERIDAEQINKDEQIARRLQEEENKTSSLDSKAIDKGDSLIRQRRELEEQERSKARREQEENDRRIALEAQALEEEEEMKRSRISEHERLINERRKLLAKQNKEQQELKDRRLAQKIAYEDAQKAGLVSNRPMSYSSKLRPRTSASCPFHMSRMNDVRTGSFNAFGSIGSYRNGCGSYFGGEDDVIDGPTLNTCHSCRKDDVLTYN
ncbi:roquin-2-like isoform X2 [Actinia tenebrosa]|uniref:RING-type E3 ubiquitin transferase n=1 Tax=Actinia tenebrosa TaxID=6105 RepID=A0A6P8HNT3_ACTTE|nr:roquin-2-like isoform X2 [Actinia tenebrosa]